MIAAPRFLAKFMGGSAARGEPYPSLDFPALGAKHLRGAKLFANREALIASLPLVPGGTIAEIGVAHGDFSEFLLAQLAPKTLVAFDIFNMHEAGSFWGKDTRQLLQGMKHLDFYQHRFRDRGDQVITEPGVSYLTLAKYPDRTFDMIYVDAAHDYPSVKRDADLALDKVKSDGFLVFNDYIMYDHLVGEPYGVVQVVNQILVERDLRIYALALERHLFCDIAFRRSQQ
jgi:disulfide oxidoreductase YuzD